MGNNAQINKKINLLFITQDDPFYIKIFFEEFLKKYPDLSEIKGVVISSVFGRKSIWFLIKQMYDLYGFIDFMRMGLRFAKVKFLGYIANVCHIKNTYLLSQLFACHGICCEHSDDINNPDFISRWAKENIDIIISVASSKIFKKQLISLPAYGCINIHHAKLPYYRGMMPNFWQMYHREKFAGITVHKINEKIDEGDIILQREVFIEDEESLDNLIKRTKKIGAECIIEVIGLIRNNKVKLIPNCPKQGSYFSFPSKKDVREFKRRGRRLL